MNFAACQNLPLIPLAGTWYRAIQLQFWNSLLAWRHTRTIPGRFNAGNSRRPGFPTFYLADNQQVALFEVQALLGSPLPPATVVPNPNGHWAIINVQVQLKRIADLTDFNNRRLIDCTVQELTGDWRGYSLRSPLRPVAAPYWTDVPTQRLGHALHAIRGLQGFMTYSSKVPTNKNLIVFPGKLRAGSLVRLQNPVTGQTQTIP